MEKNYEEKSHFLPHSFAAAHEIKELDDALGREDEHGVFAVLIFCGKLVGFAVAYRFDEDGAYFLMVIVRLIIRLLGL